MSQKIGEGGVGEAHVSCQGGGGRPLNEVEIYLTEKGGLTPWRTP